MGRARYRRRVDGVCEIVPRPRLARAAASGAARAGVTVAAALALVASGALLLTVFLAVAVPLVAGALLAVALVYGPAAVRRVASARRAQFSGE